MDTYQIKPLDLSDLDSLTINSSSWISTQLDVGTQTDLTMISSGCAADSITISSGTQNTITGGYGAIPGTAASGIYTTTGTSAGPWINPVTIHQSGTIDLQGKDADIKINGESIMETLRSIQDKLNILRPNPELEAEWDQLKELGDQYRKLEAEFKEKSKMWNMLKK